MLEWLTELKETLKLTSFLKDMIKDVDEQPDEEIHRKRSGRVLSSGASVPLELGCVTLLVWMCSTNVEALNPLLLGFYGGFLM